MKILYAQSPNTKMVEMIIRHHPRHCLLNATIVYNSIPTNRRLSGLEFRVKVIEGLIVLFICYCTLLLMDIERGSVT